MCSANCKNVLENQFVLNTRVYLLKRDLHAKVFIKQTNKVYVSFKKKIIVCFFFEH